MGVLLNFNYLNLSNTFMKLSLKSTFERYTLQISELFSETLRFIFLRRLLLKDILFNIV